ncbi:MAG: energy transducer TonB [Betaproteobacteria bacterium]|nr:MAG: energy transducer TonB [Betaproteobacteria bacterium]
MPEQTLSAFALPAQQHLIQITGWRLTSSDVLPVTLAFSIVFHAFLLLITFTAPEAPARKPVPQLDVVLVNSQSASRPVDATLLAQTNLDAGGNTESDVRAKSNLPALAEMQLNDSVELSSRRVEQLEERAARLLATVSGQMAMDPITEPLPQTTPRDNTQEQLAQQRRLEVARLEAQIAKEWQAYQKLPRRKFIGARAQSVVYAEYVEKWRERIETVGTQNYPEEARRRKLFGSLLLTVSINADGTVEQVEVDRSSGYNILDRAARRIVELAGPFPPFPADIRNEYDILSITRQWSFTRNDLGVTVAQ